MNTIMKKLFLASLAAIFTVMAAGGTNPVLNIKGNGLANQVTLNPSSVLSIKVDMEPDSLLGSNADWWVVAKTPSGYWYSWVYPTGWINIGTDITTISVTYQGPLFSLTPFEILNASNLAEGNYQVYFGVDTNMNGVLDYQSLTYSTLNVTVSSSTPTCFPPQVLQNGVCVTPTVNNKDNQTISFFIYPSKLTIGTTGTISTTTTSFLPATLSSATPSVCTVSGTVVTAVASGTCTILANQAGNAYYNAAPQVSQNIAVNNKDNQTISFFIYPSKLTIGTTGTISTTTTSFLPATLSSATPSVCTVSGTVVTAVASGTCTILANQAGNAYYNAAPQVGQNIIVGLYQNNNPLDSGSHSSATRTDSLTVKEDTQGMYVTLSLCSQSASNYFKNGVNLRLLKDGNEIARKSESYDSQSIYGPIPCFDHILEFPAIWLKANDNITLETTVSSGDYKNYLTEETVYAGVQAGVNQTKSCPNGATLPFSGGILANNQWGGTPIQQCIFSQSDGVAGWFSEWTDGVTNVSPNYPEIICGQSPWTNTSTSPLLPMVLTDLSNSSLIVDWNLENYATGKFNLALEAWITSGIVPKPQERLYEVMLMPYALGMVPDGVVQAMTLNVGGDTFDFYIGARSDATAMWTFYTFVPHSSHLGTASIDFGQILSWLVGHGYINPNSVLADIEFGNEIMSGRLRTVIISYSVKFNQQAVCHLP